MENPQIKTKVARSGNSYIFRIPKALVDTKVLEEGEEYVVAVKGRSDSLEDNADTRICTPNPASNINIHPLSVAQAA